VTAPADIDTDIDTETDADGLAPQSLVRDDCPSPQHNTLAVARREAQRCICPRATQLRDRYLARRREHRRSPDLTPAPRPSGPIIPPEMFRVRGDAAQALLAPYDAPPHACVGEDPELWFSPIPEDQALARSICFDCPLTSTCAQAATANGWEGVWGGVDEDERRNIRRSRIQVS
jgi:WhiB family redox-sensing transcriptional regulator